MLGLFSCLFQIGVICLFWCFFADPGGDVMRFGRPHLDTAFKGMRRANATLRLPLLPVSSVASVVLVVYSNVIVDLRIHFDCYSFRCGSLSQTLPKLVLRLVFC